MPVISLFVKTLAVYAAGVIFNLTVGLISLGLRARRGDMYGFTYGGFALPFMALLSWLYFPMWAIMSAWNRLTPPK